MAKKEETPKLENHLVLSKWILSKFGLPDNDAMKFLGDKLRDEKTGWDEMNIFHFRRRLENVLPEKRDITNDMLAEYDRNIFVHWQAISHKRNIIEHRDIYPQYFQYLSLLFCEYYLDRWARDKDTGKDTLLKEINSFLENFDDNSQQEQTGWGYGWGENWGGSLKQKKVDKQISNFSTLDLNKLAFWIATGGGKTLIMHCNILQLFFYIKKHKLDRHFNKVILITPNEGLSNQHMEEFELSDIAVKRYDNKLSTASFIGASHRGFVVEITEASKMKDTKGIKTFDVAELGTNNIVLVDEGHRGSGGEEWFSKRQQVCQNGFSFEYSATFGQSVNSLSGQKQKEMLSIYSKSILFDYSYKFFFRDGYGKHFVILNLKDKIETYKQLYLTASLLSFYQQCRLYQDKKTEFEPYLLDDPLMIFVGSSVSKEESDIQKIIEFFADFISDKNESIRNIDNLLKGTHGLGDRLLNAYLYLNTQFSQTDSNTAEKVFSDILKLVFQTDGSGLLHVDYLKGSSGEIGLRVGEADYFGVINVGDASSVAKKVKEREAGNIVCSDKPFSTSLFDEIKAVDSKIRVLIGAKKFVEGWSSWRVSSMGLMNIGKNEGSQIIQLFGRGVRLKGYDFSIKRSEALRLATEHPKYLTELETLNIFGVSADYMELFDKYIEDEGVVQEELIKLPVIQNFAKTQIEKLKVILPKKDAPVFKEKQVISLDKYEKIKTKVSADWSARIEARTKRDDLKFTNLRVEASSLPAHVLAFLDYDELYLTLLAYKKKNAMYNIEITKEAVVKLMKDNSWYELYIPPSLLEFDDFSKLNLWQEIAADLLQKYCRKFYLFMKDEFDAPYREYRTVKEIYENSNERVNRQFLRNLEFEYEIAVKKSEEALIKGIKALSEKLTKTTTFNAYKFELFGVERHLYHPLIHLEKNAQAISVKPVSLNEHEKKFIDDLKNYLTQEKDSFFKDKEIFVLRNQSKGTGVSFFDEGNFYPDFIIWLFSDNKQHIIFADPHGLRNSAGLSDSKLQFFKRIKAIEADLKDANVILDSFILSPTKYNDVHWKGDIKMSDFEEQHVLFMYDDNEYIGKIFAELVVK